MQLTDVKRFVENAEIVELFSRELPLYVGEEHAVIKKKLEGVW